MNSTADNGSLGLIDYKKLKFENVPIEMENKDIMLLFLEFGEIEKFKFNVIDNTKAGFMQYFTEEDAKKAHQKLNGE